MTVTKSFTAAGDGPELLVRDGESFDYDVSGTFVGTWALQQFNRGGWLALVTGSSTDSGTITVDAHGREAARIRFRCISRASGTIATELDPSTSEVTAEALPDPSGAASFKVTEDGPMIAAGKSLLGPAGDYTGARSYQPVGPDLNLAAGAGRDVADGSSFLAAIMGNVLGDTLTKTGNYLAGLIGKYSVTGAKATLYPAGGVLGIVADNDAASIPDAPVVAVLDGDSAVAKAIAWFKARTLNSTSGSGCDFGLDFFDSEALGLSYLQNVIRKAFLRTPNQVCQLEGSGAPVDGTTGDDFAGTGSLYVDYTNGELYINTGTITDSVWKKVTHA